MTKNRNSSIDIFRVIGSFLIIMIHTNKGNLFLNFIANTFGRLVVPIFMIITAFFYFKQPSVEKRNKIIKNLLSLWIIWQIIYIPIGIWKLKNYSLQIVLFELVKGLFGKSIFYRGSWYLIATAFGLYFVDELRRKNFRKSIYVIGMVIYFVDCVTSSYISFVPMNGILKKVVMFITPSSTVITGFLWVSLALILSKNEVWFKRKMTLINFVIFMVLLSVEYFFVHNGNSSLMLIDNDMYIFLPLCAMCLFALLLKKPFYLSYDVSMFFRNVATLVFFIQFGNLEIFSKINDGFLYFCCVSIVSLLMSTVIVKASENKHFVLLKRLM